MKIDFEINKHHFIPLLERGMSDIVLKMKLRKKESRNSHRGIIGVESAIVMIAFVIVAAALAFVVLNMGFATSQQAKTTVKASITEASSSLQISGKVSGIGCVACSTPVLNATMIPLKIGSGGESVNLQKSLSNIRYFSNTIEYGDIYKGAITDQVFTNPTDAFDEAVIQGWIDSNPITGAAPTNTGAIMYWVVTASPQNAVIDQGEHVVLAIAYQVSDQPAALDRLSIELVTPSGAPVSIVRNVPQITTKVVDMR